MTTMEERLANMEKILLLKYGTLDYKTIKKNHEENLSFWKEMNQRAKKLNEETKKLAEKSENHEEQKKALDKSMEELQEIRKKYGFDSFEHKGD